MSTSSIPTFIPAYLTLTRAAVPAGTPVFDVDGVTDGNADLVIYVGNDDEDADGYANNVIDGAQQWATTNRTRDERYAVPCLLVVRNGDADMDAARVAAFATLATIEAACLVDPTVAGTALYVLHEVTRVDAIQTAEGAVCRVAFRVNVRARIC